MNILLKRKVVKLCLQMLKERRIKLFLQVLMIQAKCVQVITRITDEKQTDNDWIMLKQTQVLILMKVKQRMKENSMVQNLCGILTPNQKSTQLFNIA